MILTRYLKMEAKKVELEDDDETCEWREDAGHECKPEKY